MMIQIEPPIAPSVVPTVLLIFDKGEKPPRDVKEIKDMMRNAIKFLPSDVGQVKTVILETKPE